MSDLYRPTDTCTDMEHAVQMWVVPVEPEHQHQWLPWLTLPNGSSWTQCVPCGEQFQYDHVGVSPYARIGDTE